MEILDMIKLNDGMFSGSIKNIEDFFYVGMDRELNKLINPSECKKKLNLGGGNKEIDGFINLQLPEWNADIDELPFDDCSVSHIYAFHFLEHLNNPVNLLMECNRVLMNGGVMNILVPYYSSQMAHQDLDHKKFFSENTWRMLFNNKYYNTAHGIIFEWGLEVVFNIIIGIEERNLVLLTQLIKKNKK
jgi:SAM-dependent methyltransferase